MNKSLLTIAAFAATLPAMGATAVYDAVSLAGNTHLQGVERLEAPVSAKGLMRAPGDAPNITWGYCDEPYNALPLGTGEVKMGILIDSATLSGMAGNQITALQIANPAAQGNNRFINPCSSVTIWVTEDLNGTPIATTEGSLGSGGFEWSTVAFDTPIDIPANGDLFVGYTVDVPTDPATYCYISDGYYTGGEGAGLVYSDRTINDQNQIAPGELAWRDWAPAAGYLCLRIVVEGDNLPMDRAQLADAAVPGTVVKGETFSFDTTVVGQGANNAAELTYLMEIEGMEPQTYVAKPAGSVNFNEVQTATVEFTSDVMGVNIPYTLTLTQVNGVDNLSISSVSGLLNSVTEGYKRNVVFEEFTGNWCGYCVMGIAGMEYMRNNYADKGFIGIAVHGQRDPMQVMDTPDMPYYELGNYISGFPSSFVNRQMGVNVYPAPPTIEEAFLNIVDVPSIGEINATFTYDNKTANISTTTTFGLDVEEANFSVAYTVIEDEVGPYVQTNYMAGQQGDYYGWEDKPAQVSMKYNEVARKCSKPMGIENSLPASVERGVAYEYAEEFRMMGVKTPANCSLVAMIINNATGLIENACIVKASEDTTGIDSVSASAASLAQGGYGFVKVAEAGAAVYTVDGRRVAVAAEAGNIELPAGIYIVSANGRAAKVVVR
ncbi:MAG: hypothetical protein K2K26_10720 [Muribaculaceae bacterium]|nr:hypothetical protein [Muribaculaceae bacterium]